MPQYDPSRPAIYQTVLLWLCTDGKRQNMVQSSSMQRSIFSVIAFAILASSPAHAQQMPQTPPMFVAAAPQQMRADMGGGFIEYLFGDHGSRQSAPPPVIYSNPPAQSAQPVYANNGPVDPSLERVPPGFTIDPQFLRQQVDY